jgi:hypothetical protein
MQRSQSHAEESADGSIPLSPLPNVHYAHPGGEDRHNHDHVSGNLHTQHVDIGHFDPVAVNELRRSMSRASQHQEPKRPTTGSTSSGGSTLAGNRDHDKEERFDFEKTIRGMIQRCF